MTTQEFDRIYDAYLQDVGKTQIPSSAWDEHILLYRYHELRDPAARKRLIEGNLRFVIKTARQYHGGNPDLLQTLIAAGNVGLVTAVERYCQWVIGCHSCDTQNYVKRTTQQRCKSCGTRLRKANAQRYTTRFLTYAHWWIAEAIRSELYSMSTVYVPSHRLKEQHRLKKQGENVGIRYVPYDEVDSPDLSSTKPHHPHLQTHVEEALVNRHACALLYQTLAKLNTREAYVIIAYYGLREDPKNLREIGATLGVCSERVRQIKEQGLRELRRKLRQQRVHHTGDAFN